MTKKTLSKNALEPGNACSICSADYEDEELVQGYFGILPVSFCPTCFGCMLDMASQYIGERTEE